MKNNSKFFIIFCIVLLGTLVYPSGAISKTSSSPKVLFETTTGILYPSSNCGSPLHGTIKYEAKLFKNGIEISDNSSVAQNDVLRIDPVWNDNNIFWIMDDANTPYGFWVSGAGLGGIDGMNPFCEDQSFVSTPMGVSVDNSGSSPTYSFSGSGTCTQSDSSCIVKSGGTITATITFPSRTFKIYAPTWTGNVADSLTLTDGYVMQKYTSRLAYSGTAPGDSISFDVSCTDNTWTPDPSTVCSGTTFTQTSNCGTTRTATGTNSCNNPPATPSISCPATSIINVSSSFTASATDPDGNTLNYGYDWDNNGSVDQWMPSISGYVNSGTAQTASKSWATTGNKTIKVQACDNNGSCSGWGSCVTNVIYGGCAYGYDSGGNFYTLLSTLLSPAEKDDRHHVKFNTTDTCFWNSGSTRYLIPLGTQNEFNLFLNAFPRLQGLYISP